MPKLCSLWSSENVRWVDGNWIWSDCQVVKEKIWRGDPSNPVPNPIQEPISRAEKFITNKDSAAQFTNNRAIEVRRDTDTQKDFTITLYDIDETIMTHLEQMQLQVQDVGKMVKVPVLYGSPERWVSAQRDGYLRDKQGRIILPAMIIKRTTSENDPTLQFFNRYLNTPAIKLYSQKNRYTQFATLIGQNVPVNEVYNIVVPSHMLLTYHFIIWTAYVEQMNKLVENLQFNTKDYWGSTKGFRFRTRIETFGHQTEIQAGEDRMIKTEGDIVTHGYILPEYLTKLERHELTTKKSFTPKKVVMGAEVVATDFNIQRLDKNREKWQSPKYPNIQTDTPVPPPPVTVVSGLDDSSAIMAQIVTTLRSITQSPIINPTSVGLDNTAPALRVVPPPTSMAAVGQEGYVSFDANYFYIYTGGQWRRVAIAQFTQVPACQEGAVSFDNKYFYLYSSGSWRQVAISQFT